METAVEKIAALSFIVVGLSHVFRPRVWAQFFTDLARRGETASLYIVLLHLPVGTLIVAFHNVWRWPGVVLTVIGWGYVVKSLVYGLFPAVGLRMLARTSVERGWEFALPGLLLAAYGGWLAYTAFGA